MDLIRKHLMIEGQIEKECLVRILNEVTDVYRKLLFSMIAVLFNLSQASDLFKNFSPMRLDKSIME